jgi:hypothetical protein
VIRHDVPISLSPIDPASLRAAVVRHHRSLRYSGDEFIVRAQLKGTHYAVSVEGESVGVVGWHEKELSLLSLSRAARRYERQVMEFVLDKTGVPEAIAASWDDRHIDLFGAFATTIESAAYQFELFGPDELTAPIPGLTLTQAIETDRDYLEGPEFESSYVGYLEQNHLWIARRNGERVGLGLLDDAVLDPAKVCIGMYTNRSARRQGVGRSILSLLSRDQLDQGKVPVAGCWWRNWASRATLEAAGLTCVGTIFRMGLDSGRFGVADD